VRVLYLHGFASSARSSKASYFKQKLHELGVELETPDFNEPDFSTLTITRMVDQVLALLDERSEPAVLIGSSLGAFVAVQAAVARPALRQAQGRPEPGRAAALVRSLVLLAPALDFGGNRMKSLGDRGLDEWERTNRLDVFHYGYGRVMPVHYELYADARRYDCVNAVLSMPIQVFQGRRDDAVDPVAVEQWSRARPNVELHLLDDDHQLTASVDYIWNEMRRFVGLGGV
jgi:pimeloyl-ACP methyl ester carboxylesterase